MAITNVSTPRNSSITEKRWQTVCPDVLSTLAVTVGSRVHLFCKHGLGGLELMISPKLVSPENWSDFECQK